MIADAAWAILTALLWLLPFAALLVILALLGCALQRVWPQVPRWMRREVPACCPDGKALTVPEQERMDVIERGYGRTAQEPGWRL